MMSLGVVCEKCRVSGCDKIGLMCNELRLEFEVERFFLNEFLHEEFNDEEIAVDFSCWHEYVYGYPTERWQSPKSCEAFMIKGFTAGESMDVFFNSLELHRFVTQYLEGKMPNPSNDPPIPF